MSKSTVKDRRGKLIIRFRIEGRDNPTDLQPGVPYTTRNVDSQPVKDIRQLIKQDKWAELAVLFPNCKRLDPYRVIVKPIEEQTTFRGAAERYLSFQGDQVHSGPKGKSVATPLYYRNILRPHIWTRPEFADKQLRLIDMTDVQALEKPLHAKGSHTTARRVRRAVGAVFNFAMGVMGPDGRFLADHNPVDRLNLSERGQQQETNERQLNAFTPDEQGAIIAAARDGWERWFVTVALATGLRPGENFGLKVSNVDLDRRVVMVRQTWTRFGEGKLKNRWSRRDVNLTEAACEALRAALARVESCGSQWLWQMLPVGKAQPVNPQNFSRRLWPAILERAGVERRDPYQTRHTFAWNLLNAGKPLEYIREQMGHEDLEMLIKVYLKKWPTAPSVSEVGGQGGSCVLSGETAL